MSLQGTLDTFSLPDVLRLLAATGKSGHLHLDLPRGAAAVALDRGRAAAITVPGGSAAVEPTSDAAVELLRATGGTFRFDAGDVSPGHAEPVDVESLLDDADGLLQDWRDVEAVVPSPACAVTLVPALSAAVTVDPDGWQVVVAVGAGTTAMELADALRLGELATGRRVKDLVELGLLQVGAPTPGAVHHDPSAVLRGGAADGAVPADGAPADGHGALGALDGDHEVDTEDLGAHDPDARALGADADALGSHDVDAYDAHARSAHDRSTGADVPSALGTGTGADALGAHDAGALDADELGSGAQELAVGAFDADGPAADDLDFAADDRTIEEPVVGDPDADDVGSDAPAGDHALLEALGEAATVPAPATLDADEVARRLSEPAPAAEGGAHDGQVTDGQPVDRSALLKFLSSVRP